MGAPAAEPSGHRDAVFGLARREGCLLLVRNPRVTGGERRSFWDLPGGGVRPGERLPEALVREWREETGLEAQVGALRLVVDGRKQTTKGACLRTWRAFIFDVATEGDAQPGDGIEVVAWVPEVDASARLDAPYHEALRRHLQGDAAFYRCVTWTEPAPTDPVLVGLPRHLLVLAAAASVGAAGLLAREVVQALAAGESAERIAEALLQIVPFAGYPRAIVAFGIVREQLDARQTSLAEAPDRAARGLDVFAAVYGARADELRARLEALDPLLARWTIEHAYGRVLAREGHLTLLERELLAVAVLTALGGLEAPLLGHMRAAVRVGATPDQVAAAVTVVPSSFGEGRREAARRLLQRL